MREVVARNVGWFCSPPSNSVNVDERPIGLGRKTVGLGIGAYAFRRRTARFWTHFYAQTRRAVVDDLNDRRSHVR
jgi:hypothetical protein